MMLDEQKLIQRVLRGDPEAGNRLVALYYRDLYRYFLHLSGNVNDAEELTQETFVKAWQALPGFQSRSSFRTWLHAIGFREFANRRNLPSLGDLSDETTDDRQAFVGQLIDAVTVEEAIATLPTTLRITFITCHVHELSVKETAQVLAVPVGTVLRRLHTARLRLREALATRIANECTNPGKTQKEEPIHHEISQAVL